MYFSVDIVVAASQVLKSSLMTASGMDFAAVYKEKLSDTHHLFQYLQPFRARKKVIKRRLVYQTKISRNLLIARQHNRPTCELLLLQSILFFITVRNLSSLKLQ